MNFISFCIALFLLGISISLALGLFWLLFGPLLRIFQGTQGSSQIKRAEGKLTRIDGLIESRSFAEAIKQLRKALVLELPSGDEKLSKIKIHNQNVLARCLVIAEEAETSADNIAEVEHALMERAELQGLLLKARESYESLRTRRQQAGKEVPSWSKTDFEARIKEISAELEKNTSTTERALDELFDSLAQKSGENIIYH